MDSVNAGELSRRDFVKWTLAASCFAGADSALLAADSPAASADMPFRTLGRTGEKISAIGLGGYHIGISRDENESIRLIRAAIDRGINFMDNCWDYHNGGSEIRMGKALRDGYRDKVFLMSKIDGHTRTAAARQIDESLKRLQTDHVDLMQFHEVIRRSDPERIFASDGSMEAMRQAQQAGKVRFIGFTGHKHPDIHLSMLETARKNGFRFDAVQMPLNVMDAHFRSFEMNVVPVLVKEEIGVLGMKPLGSGAILRSRAVTPIECLHYALNLPTSTVITGMQSMRDLEQALEAARTFKPMNAEAVAALRAKSREHATAGEFEKFKTSTQFDGTVQNPQWLG